jgi:formylglycine-generating enzyme required for sulfatase activity
MKHCLAVFYFFVFGFCHALTFAENSQINAPVGMVLIPAGDYLAGSNDATDEKPMRKIFLDSFYIDSYETTQKQFREVMGSHRNEFRGDDLPVEKVTWYEARDYCAKLGKRLPSEAEWEKAARGGNANKFYWGDTPDDAYAWHWQNSERKTHIVGQKKPNAYGLYDVSGNVWEWTGDLYAADYYQVRPQKNPKGPYDGKKRVLRGGSFMDIPDGLRITRRFYDYPTSRFKNFGFRCARSVLPIK